MKLGFGAFSMRGMLRGTDLLAGENPGEADPEGPAPPIRFGSISIDLEEMAPIYDGDERLARAAARRR